MSQSFGTCRGCGKQILWTKTAAGRNMPCDPTVIWFTPEGGPETFVTPEGRVLRGRRDRRGEMMGYISHFATCPAAKRFRREKE